MADGEHTARLALALIQPGQAQKEMTHNEALAVLDLVVQARVVAAGVQNPPDAPEPGACWIVGDAPGGAWGGCAGMLAGWTSGGWRFVTPFDGMQIWLSEAGEFLQFSNGAWRQGVLHGKVSVNGVQVVGQQQAAIPDPQGGATVDAEARAALSALLGAARAHGLIAAA